MNYEKRIAHFFSEGLIVMNQIGSKYNKMKEGDIGIVKLTYLTISERIARNFHGIHLLLSHPDELYSNNRHPLMLLLRGVIDDLTIGAYLLQFIEHEISFRNELKVLNIDFYRFSEFMIRNEAKLSFFNPGKKERSESELNSEIEFQLQMLREGSPEYYIKRNEKWELKKPAELRTTSDP
ncbi:MAG TPA: hypothetical protein VGE24_05600, partial [Emticicia sp.]